MIKKCKQSARSLHCWTMDIKSRINEWIKVRMDEDAYFNDSFSLSASVLVVFIVWRWAQKLSACVSVWALLSVSAYGPVFDVNRGPY